MLKVFIQLLIISLFQSSSFANTYIQNTQAVMQRTLELRNMTPAQRDYANNESKRARNIRVEWEKDRKYNHVPPYGRSQRQIDEGTYSRGQGPGTPVFLYNQQRKVLGDNYIDHQILEQMGENSCSDYYKKNKDLYLLQNYINYIDWKLNSTLKNTIIANKELLDTSISEEGDNHLLRLAKSKYSKALQVDMEAFSKSMPGLYLVAKTLNNDSDSQTFRFDIVIPGILKPFQLIIESREYNNNSNKVITAVIKKHYKYNIHNPISVTSDELDYPRHNSIVEELERDINNDIISKNEICGDQIIEAHDLGFIVQHSRSNRSSYDSKWTGIKKDIVNFISK